MFAVAVEGAWSVVLCVSLCVCVCVCLCVCVCVRERERERERERDSRLCLRSLWKVSGL